MRKIKYIVIHHNGVAGRGIENIRRTHKAKGWKDVGYHWVQHENGAWHKGRPESKVGAHVRGLNRSSIGICMIGNFNKTKPTITQLTSLHFKLLELRAAYPDAKIIGHREVNRYVRKADRTRKSCPGGLVDLATIRQAVRLAL